MLALIIHKLFFIHYFIWCIKINMHYIKIFIYKDGLHNCGGKDVKQFLRGNEIFNNANACIKYLCISNT